MRMRTMTDLRACYERKEEVWMSSRVYGFSRECVAMYGRHLSENKAANMAGNNGSSGGGPGTGAASLGRRSSTSAIIRRELNKFFLAGVKWTGRPSLGVGAYGSVEPLELHGMLCAGKKIHDVLINVENEGADDIAHRFVDECKLMSELRHPNVVQFLGLCLSPSSSLPILVMEHLYCSLDDLLETTPDIPLYMKRSILRDVALGLAHLHGRHPAIIHRDLTARNVLLNNNMRAKLADFGVARILNLPAGKLEATLSRVPGTSTYMPPEVFSREAKYNTAVDIFSFGHLLLFTITQKQPGVEAATFVDSSGRIVARSELERREDSMSTLYGVLGREHPFVAIVTECLQTNAALRPSIFEVLTNLEEMRSSVRDPYTRQTRLTLTQMIRKQAAENKKIRAELKRAQEDLLNAKRRIVHLTEKLHRYSQFDPTSPTSTGNDSFKHNYYNTVESFIKEGEHHDRYTSVQNAGDGSDPFHARNLSSPALSSTAITPSPPPPIPSSPRPSCLSPESDQTPPSFQRYHSHMEPPPSQATDHPLLSLPRTSARHLSKSHDNLHSDPSYEQIKDVAIKCKRSTSNLLVKGGGGSSTGPILHGFSLSDSESDSDFDEFEPQFLRRSPQGVHHPSPKLGSLPSSGFGDFYHTSSSEKANRYHTSPHASLSSAMSSPYYQTHLRYHQQTSATLGASSPSSSPYTIFSGGSGGGGGGPSSLSLSPRSLSQGPPSLSPPSLPSTSNLSPSSTFDSIPRVSVQNPVTEAAMESLKPLTTGMAGKIHFYTDLEPNTLVLLQSTEQGKIPGVRYEADTGQVQIESESSERTKLASEKFRSAYVYATSHQISLTVDVPGDVTESTVEEIISTQLPKFSKSAVSYNGLESSLLVLSFSGGELMRLKQALENAIQRASGAASVDESSGNLTGRTRLSIKRGVLAHEETDVIVFSNTSNLACKDGVAKAVDEMSQGAIVRQCKAFITKHGLLGFGETILMRGGGRLKAKHVIHVNPGIGSNVNLESVVRKLVSQALKQASGKSATSIAFSPVVSSWTESNGETVAKTMLEAIRLFASERKGRKLRDVRIVVREQAAFDCFNERAKLS